MGTFPSSPTISSAFSAVMLISIPSMGHVILLLYVYGVLGVNLFAQVDPQHWGSLGTACLTLFQMLTLEGWVEIQRVVLPAARWHGFSSAASS
jgi:voltage-gated sodium channel